MTSGEMWFKRWQEKMSKKTDRERHNYAMTWALLISAFMLFFVLSNWYYKFSGETIDTSILSSFVDIFPKK